MSTTEVVKDALLHTGATFVLWLLAILSVISLAIIVERLFTFRKLGLDLRRAAERLDSRLANGERETAIAELEETSSVAGSIAAAGLRLADRGAAAVDRAMESAVALERSRLERWLAYLGTVGNNAPFVGLFGTVVGVIGAFEKLGQGSAGGRAAAGELASQAVMASIAEALVATAVGIAVALPAVAFYNYFKRRIAQLLADSEVLSKLVLAYLSGVG